MPHNKVQMRNQIIQRGMHIPEHEVVHTNNTHDHQHQMTEPTYSYCCVPRGCDRYRDDPILNDEPMDAVRVVCNNDHCTEGNWMHADCFQEWEQQVLSFLRSCGRARSWSEKQRLQNLWTKRGYDLAFKACGCKCGKGHLRKDTDYEHNMSCKKVVKPKVHKHAAAMPAKMMPATLTRPVGTGIIGSHSNGSIGSGLVRSMPNGNNTNVIGSPPMNNHPHHQHNHSINNSTSTHHHAQMNGANTAANMRPQLRVRTNSISSTGSSCSPPSSAGTPPQTPGSGSSNSSTTNKKKFDFFSNLEQAAAGNIFQRRTDYSVFSALPRHQQNPYHIKMEDEGPHGNDETRCFVLTNLSTHGVTSVNCVVCCRNLPVFDKYPLIDGTFFLSPQRYNTDLQVLNEHKMLYLNAVCMGCLQVHPHRSLRCLACKTPWYGSAFVIGSMYAYDVFAALPCCARRLACKNCTNPIIDPSCAFQFFSEYSKPMRCPHCQVEDHHFIKPLEQIYAKPPMLGMLHGGGMRLN